MVKYLLRRQSETGHTKIKKNISYSNVQKNNVFLSIKDGLLDSSKYRSNIEGSSENLESINNLISEQLLANSTAQCHARNRSLILMLPTGAFTRAAVCIGECVASKVARSSTCVCVWGGMEF